MLGWFVLASLAINEIRSIIENIVECGYKVPQILIKGLDIANKVINKKKMIKVFNIKLDSYSFTGTAVIVGYLLTNEFDVLEQAALGAWFNVVGDILASNSSFSAILEEQSDNFDLEDEKTIQKLI